MLPYYIIGTVWLLCVGTITWKSATNPASTIYDHAPLYGLLPWFIQFLFVSALALVFAGTHFVVTN